MKKKQHLTENSLARRSIVHLFNCICRQPTSNLLDKSYKVSVWNQEWKWLTMETFLILHQSVHAGKLLHPNNLELPALDLVEGTLHLLFWYFCSPPHQDHSVGNLRHSCRGKTSERKQSYSHLVFICSAPYRVPMPELSSTFSARNTEVHLTAVANMCTWRKKYWKNYKLLAPVVQHLYDEWVQAVLLHMQTLLREVLGNCGGPFKQIDQNLKKLWENSLNRKLKTV